MAYIDFLDKFIKSVSMKEYLRSIDLHPMDAIEIIMLAPIPVDVKIEELMKLRGFGI